ncbi:MAG TPA: Hsp33 family molecular chaperone HslO [bacterium]|nr:Hsp33 family molecular chaperone HslO [bacterium]
MRDYMVRATVAGERVRALATVTTETVEDARIRHATSATATAALGRSLTAAALLSAGLKDGQLVTLRVLGDGPAGGIITQADAAGRVRGYVMNPQADLPATPARKLDVGGLVGRKGTLHVTRDLGMRTPYYGSAPLVSGEIAEDLAAYFARSEQVPSAVALGVLVGRDLRVLAAGGLCVQALPGADPDVVAQVESRLRSLPPITDLVAAGQTPEQLMTAALDGLTSDGLATGPVTFTCQCNRQRVEEMLSVLGVDELESLLAQEGQAEVTCRFCGDRYVLNGDEMRALITALRRGEAAV